jgi:ankyrin repeat protein
MDWGNNGLNKRNVASVLKDKGANMNIRDSFSYTPLHVAAGLDNVDVMNGLLPGAVTEITGPNQWTALHVAAGNSHDVSVYFLMTHSANSNAVESHGWTPLHIAVGNGFLPIVSRILSFPTA